MYFLIISPVCLKITHILIVCVCVCVCVHAHTCAHLHTHVRVLVSEAHLTMKTGLDIERWAIIVYFCDWHQSLII